MSKNSEDRLALVSLLITSDVQRNLSAIADAVERAHAAECRLVCFPECALTGLVDTEDYEAGIKLAVDIPGSTTGEIGFLAKRYDLHIAIGLLERDQGKLHDTAVLFNGDGEIILKYSQIFEEYFRYFLKRMPIGELDVEYEFIQLPEYLKDGRFT